MALNMKIKGRSSRSQANSGAQHPPMDQPDTSLGVERALKYAQKKPMTTQREAKAAIKDALIVIEKAIMGIDAAKSILAQAREIAETAKSLVNTTSVGTLAEEFDTLCTKLDLIVGNCQQDGKNLIAGGESKFLVPLSDARHSNFVVQASNLTCAGLNLPRAADAFGAEDTLLEILNEVDRAIDQVEHTGSIYCSNATVLAKHYASL
jgi:hypothetical protein